MGDIYSRFPNLIQTNSSVRRKRKDKSDVCSRVD